MQTRSSLVLPRRAPRMMILFDPDLGTDLDPDPAQQSAVRVQPAAAHSASIPRNSRPPSARALARFLRDAQAAVRLRGEVTVLLTSDTAIRRLNRQFRGKNKATDVLSFPADSSAPGSEGIAGDLAISVPTARRQAVAQGHALGVEIKILMLHGLLHLAGYDHETDSGEMARRERLLRGRLGLPEGLIERAETPEGDGLLPIRKSTRKGLALASEGKAGRIKTAPAGAKAPSVLRQRTYGLKPVPFTPNAQRGSVLSQVRRKNPPRRTPNPSTSSGQALGHPASAVSSRSRSGKP
jgi:probable rRNA maturation factor